MKIIMILCMLISAAMSIDRIQQIRMQQNRILCADNRRNGSWFFIAMVNADESERTILNKTVHPKTVQEKLDGQWYRVKIGTASGLPYNSRFTATV